MHPTPQIEVTSFHRYKNEGKNEGKGEGKGEGDSRLKNRKKTPST